MLNYILIKLLKLVKQNLKQLEKMNTYREINNGNVTLFRNYVKFKTMEQLFRNAKKKNHPKILYPLGIFIIKAKQS